MTAAILDTDAVAARVRRPRSAARPSVVVACGWLVLVAAAALVAPVLAPQGFDVQNLTGGYQGPSAAHLLGTDALGRDILVRLMYGARPALLGAAVGLLIAVVLGVPAGLAGGYRRGVLDRVFSVVSDVLQSVPLLLILLVVFAIFGNVTLVMVAFGVFSTAPLYRVLRAATLTISDELYITAARSVGLTDTTIVFRHLAPRLAGLVRVQASLVAGIALVTEVGLGYLGLDVAPPRPSWGGMVADASQYLSTDPWMMVPSTGVVCLTVLALGVLGDVGQTPSGSRRRRRVGRLAPAAAAAAAQRSPASAPSVRDVDVLLRVDGLTVTTRASDTVLVDDVGFDVRRGEILGLVGESGAGKSVTARALLRLDDAMLVSGSVTFDGEDVSAGSPEQLRALRGRRIAYIGQDPMLALDPLFRIESQLVEAVRNHRRMSRPRAKAEARRLLEAVRISDPDQVARKRPFEISGGMAQRVAIALALAGDPDLLIADEPTTALDVSVQMEVLGLLKSLQRDRGLSVVMVTHDWGVIADVCDRAITLYAGEIVESGQVDDVFALPSHPYTAALRRADPHTQDVGSTLLSIPGSVPTPGQRPPFCRFADRCPVAVDDCRTVHPQLVPLPGVGRSSRCIRTEELREGAIHV